MRLRHWTRRPAYLGSLAAVLVSLLLTPEAGAKSALILNAPSFYGEIPARTYDVQGKPIGSASLSLVQEEDGKVRMRAESRIDGGARNVVEATFEVLNGGSQLRILSQQSQSYDPKGKSLGVLHLDHTRREGSCTPPGAERKDAEILPLPEDDRIANVPLNLLFVPLVQGSVEEIEFQVFLCRGGARIIDFKTDVTARPSRPGSAGVVEVRYRPVLNQVLSWLATRLTPELAFWFDANGEGTYLAHRMPLYSKGPEVIVVRDGISPEQLYSPDAGAP